MLDPWKCIAEKGVVPVINVEKASYARLLAKALREGGLPLIEVTLRSDASLQAIESICQSDPDMAVAAGTVLSPAQAKEAVAAGANLVVTPGFEPKTVRYCVENGIDVLPGCVTASDIAAAVDMGLSNLKFFPAEQSGGLKAIELLNGPFKNVRFVPTGGITFDNLSSYAASRSVLACGGSFMAKADVIRREDWAAVTDGCRHALDMALGIRLTHIGFNHENVDEAEKTARLLCKLLHLPLDERSKSVFAGSFVENMKQPFYGEKGHIGFKTHSIQRAMAYMEEQGFSFREESKQFDAQGRLSCIYLKEEIAGFAIHLM